MSETDWLTERPIAHRGLHGGNVPENSTPAFRAAIDNGYAIELDVRITEEGVPIVFHDRSVSWGAGTEDPIRQIPYTKIREFGIPDSQYAIPRLGVALKVIDGQVPILLDLKNVTLDIGPLESAVADRLLSYDGPFAIQSFNPLTVGYFRKHHPTWPRGQVAEKFRDAEAVARWRTALVRRLAFSIWNRPDFIAYRGTDLPYWPVTVHRKSGLPVLAWTIRSEGERERVRTHCDNVIFEGFEPSMDE